MNTLDILLVDDSDADAFISNVIIKRSSVKTVTANVTRARTRSEMVSSLADSKFHCVLLDLGLPDSQGDDTVRAATKAAGKTPVIVLSGGDQDSLNDFAERGGAVRAIQKKNLADSDDIVKIIMTTLEQVAAK